MNSPYEGFSLIKDIKVVSAVDKAAADKAEIRNLLDSVASQISSLKFKYGENNVRVQQSTFDRLNLALQNSNESGYSTSSAKDPSRFAGHRAEICEGDENSKEINHYLRQGQSIQESNRC